MRTVRVRGIVAHNGKYLFVKHAPQSDYYALAGGGLEDGEALADGLHREFMEELGVDAEVGRLLYVQQLFDGPHESLEFFFEITNGEQFTAIDLSATTHGFELSTADFIDPTNEYVLPEFLKDLDKDLQANSWPKIYVRSTSRE